MAAKGASPSSYPHPTPTLTLTLTATHPPHPPPQPHPHPHPQGGVHDGSKGSPYGITPDQCTGGFWDAIMLGKPYTEGVVPAELMAKMRREGDQP